MKAAVPSALAGLAVRDASEVDAIAAEVDFVFCAVDIPRRRPPGSRRTTRRRECPVVSNNSAHRATPTCR
jgi:aspartate-semialdehyde dehydrogenase